MPVHVHYHVTYWAEANENEELTLMKMKTDADETEELTLIKMKNWLR